MAKIISFGLVFGLLAACLIGRADDAYGAFGGMGRNGFGKLGAIQKNKSGGGGGGTVCTMNGKFDLTNTCNNIYFIGGLK